MSDGSAERWIGLKIAAVCTLALAALAAAPQADPRYFLFVRDVQIHDGSRQNFLVLDADTFQHARADLADLRLYDGERQLPYQLSEVRGRSSREEHDVPILNLAAKGDHTEFDLDLQGVPEYDSIRLRLKAKNFVVKAWAAGADALSGKASPWPTPSTLYDFSSERLGSNLTIKLPTWSFRYVHVRLGPGIAPRDVEGALVSNQQEQQAVYVPMGSCRQAESRPRQSVWHCDLPEKVPLDRILFAVDSSNVNFHRSVTVQDERGEQLASGELSRIRTRRGSTDVVADCLFVPVYGGTSGKSATIVIENGDDTPLAIGSVQPQAFERRLYFEPAGASALRLYLGDDKLPPPVYDYAKVFHEEAAAAQATLGPSTPNPAYAPRPDDRPWSERHPAMLWTAMLLAVAVLSVLAIRGVMAQRA